MTSGIRGGGVVVWLLCLQALSVCAGSFPWQIGCGSADITGPVTGVQFWGFVRADQIGEGLHLRQRARAFLIASPDTGERLAVVVCDLGSITGELHREVIDQLQQRYGDLYTSANVIVSATHTHAAPAGFWHAGVGTPFGTPLHQAYFRNIVDGVVSSIVQAHESLQPGNILVAQGNVPDAGVNRSRVAYLNNPEHERQRYSEDTDTQMTLLRFETADGPIGCLNWFAVHPTTMTYHNRLVSTDNKGYAEVAFERNMGVTWEQPGEFVAAFAQSNCGDVTGNLNLDNTGPGENEFETTRIIGRRQYVIAQELFDQADTPLQGSLGSRQLQVDFSRLSVTADFAAGQNQQTAPAAYGYAFAAGSTEDGGGHPLFQEGMKQELSLIELLVAQQFPDARPTDVLREQHRPKAILIAAGALPPGVGIDQVLSLTVARIGPLVIAAGPAEFTTMSGRRIRDTIRSVMGEDVSHVVIAGYSNGYAGYCTTQEEYETQQYEGGHTLFGPWTLAAYRQEYARLAAALAGNTSVSAQSAPVTDLRNKVPDTVLGTTADVPPEDAEFGDQHTAPDTSYRPGQTASAGFHTSNPQNHYPHPLHLVSVERREQDTWVRIASDADWSTRCRFQPGRNVSRPFTATLSWQIPADAPDGQYRLVHHHQYRLAGNQPAVPFRGVSDPFQVQSNHNVTPVGSP